mmetsp:Transcript_4332/g.6595  ORF Transcript_4332/g.6595 Transcript_4332/m.6595 type:complete len:219 (+) Transcript_4332:561-1217(+)
MHFFQRNLLDKINIFSHDICHFNLTLNKRVQHTMFRKSINGNIVIGIGIGIGMSMITDIIFEFIRFMRIQFHPILFSSHRTQKTSSPEGGILMPPLGLDPLPPLFINGFTGIIQTILSCSCEEVGIGFIGGKGSPDEVFGPIGFFIGLCEHVAECAPVEVGGFHFGGVDGATFGFVRAEFEELDAAFFEWLGVFGFLESSWHCWFTSSSISGCLSSSD